jgi:hypothetical protein
VHLTFVSRTRLLVALAISAGLALWMHGGLAGGELLCLAPALVLAAALFARCYPGERLLSALARRKRSSRPRPRPSLPAPGRTAPRVPRGGLLMGFALAVRPPPAALVS